MAGTMSWDDVVKQQGGVTPSDIAEKPARVTVFGGGSFGTALATVLARKGNLVCLLCRDPAVADNINKDHKNDKYKHVAGFELPDTLTGSIDAAVALKDVQWIVHAVPAQQTLPFLQGIAQHIPSDVPIISASKGIHTETHQLMGELIHTGLQNPSQPVLHLGGPSFAREIMECQLTAVSIACPDSALGQRAQDLFSTKTFRAYLTDDCLGVEVGGALKNVVAIAAGIVQGLGMGHNSVAALVTRGLSEMKRVGVALGARPETLSGLSGVGDLMLTCFGSLSRNQSVGRRIGQGETLEQILESMNEVAEGVPTAAAVKSIAQERNLYVPIFITVDDMLKGVKTPAEATKFLLSLPVVAE